MVTKNPPNAHKSYASATLKAQSTPPQSPQPTGVLNATSNRVHSDVLNAFDAGVRRDAELAKASAAAAEEARVEAIERSRPENKAAVKASIATEAERERKKEVRQRREDDEVALDSAYMLAQRDAADMSEFREHQRTEEAMRAANPTNKVSLGWNIGSVMLVGFVVRFCVNAAV
jgi:hypothetical protein